MTREEWRPIPHPDACYEASSLGRIRSTARGLRVLTPHPNEHGYLRVGLGIGARRRKYLVHVLIAEAFHGPRPPGEEVRHLDGDKLRNVPGNLAYGTPSRNVLDSVEHGTHVQARKDRCPQGHAYQQARGRRVCRPCAAASQARYRQRRRALA